MNIQFIKNFKRRDFIKTAVVAGAGMAVPAMVSCRRNGYDRDFEWVADLPLIRPRAIAVDKSANLIAGCNHPQKGGVYAMHRAGTDNFKLQWQTESFKVRGITVSQDNRIFFTVGDEGSQEVLVYNSLGEFLQKWGQKGKLDGEFSGPTGIATDHQKCTYIVESGSWPIRGGQRIQVFDEHGVFIRKWGSQGYGEGEFNCPTNLAIDKQGNLWVMDTYNNRILNFSQGGTLLGSFGKYGHNRGEFYCPQGIAFDGEGNIYIADTCNNRIQYFTPEGKLISVIGGFGHGKGEFWLPCDLCWDESNSQLIVADTMNDRVQVLQKV